MSPKALPPIPNLVFLKLGGSLITDKQLDQTPRPVVIQRLADEIAMARREHPELNLVIGNGAGSYGHGPAFQHGIRNGVHTASAWAGFAQVWHAAARLNRLVVDALRASGLPAISLPASASVTARAGRVARWDLTPIRSALAANLIPLIHGDVIFDQKRGGTILSTEELFEHLARHLRPQRILLAGIEAGVWVDYPNCTNLVERITPSNVDQLLPALGASKAIDVTGGMASKVLQSLAMVQELPGLQVLIFSGEHPGAVYRTLGGGLSGTQISIAE
jgi:isopentenyl phosphate kinase